MKQSNATDLVMIKELVTTKYMEAVHSGDPAKYAGLFSLNGMWMPPGSEPVAGRESIEQAEKNIFDVMSLDIVSQAVEVDVSGNIGWALGEIDGTKIPHDKSETEVFHFRLLWVVCKEDEAWKIHRQLWNVRPTEGAESYKL